MKNKSLKFKFIAAMLIGTMTLASFTIGCSKKSPTNKDASSAAEADKGETKNSTEDITFPDESETETETDKDGNVTVKITTYETDASGETVTDSEGNKVISETKSETFTKDEWENRQKETKPSNSGNNSSKDESKQAENVTTAASKVEKPTMAPAKPAEKSTAAPIQAPTTAASKPAEKPTAKPTVAPAKPAEKPTAAPTQAPATVDPRKNWKTVTFTIKGNPEYDEKDENWNLYSNGEWYFYIKEERKNWGNTLEETTRFDGGETGIVLYKYLGNSNKVTIPTSIDGYPVVLAALPFKDNKTVKEVTIPKELPAQFALFYDSVVTKVTIEKNAKADKSNFWTDDHTFNNINREKIIVYCDETLGNFFKEWDWGQNIIVYSYDGKIKYL